MLTTRERRQRRRRSVRAAVLILAANVLSAPVHAASFPCEKAERPDETTICAHRTLNDLDVELATRFEILKDILPMGGRSKLRDDQETWLAERHACGTDVACLTTSYESRLRILRAVLSEFGKQGPQ